MRIIFIALLFLTACSESTIPQQPILKRINAVDEYHNQKITDPYRNLENLEDSTTISWLLGQEDYASKILKNIPGQDRLIEKQKRFDKEKSYSIGLTRKTYDGQFFYTKLFAGDSVARLYYKKNIAAKEELLYDPSSYGKGEQKSYLINYFKPDWKGEKIAISIANLGEEISEIIIFDKKSKKIISEPLKNARPGIGGVYWLPDNSGFTYIYHPHIDPHDPNYGLNSKSLLYKLGSDPNIHKEIFSKPNNPEVVFKPEDFPKVLIYGNYYQYAFGQVSGSSRFKDMYFKTMADLPLSNKPWKLLYKKSDKVEQIDIQNDYLIFLSAKNASNYQICKTSLKNPDFENPEILIPQDKNSVISDFSVTKDGIYFVRMKNGVEAKLYQYVNGEEREVIMPKPSGSIRINSYGTKYNELTIYNEGWLEEGVLYEYTSSSSEFINISLNPPFDYPEFENLIVKEIETKSHDGTMIPISIIHKKNVKMDGKNPTLFYGYGAYGDPGNPFFSSSFLTWVNEGGIIAIAHVRGGGEKGDTWYRGGLKNTKPNTWKDMIACTQHMIKEGYTSPEKSVLMGSSAGGIMAGRAMTDRPDLYKAVILISPAMNMLRSEIQPNGLNSIKEFGTVKIEKEFKALLEMDSYHHVEKNVKYPATLITAGMKDGRVVVWDPAKFAARLQENSSNLVLFSVDFDSGHGSLNNSLEKYYKSFAEAFSFAFWQTGHPDYQPEN
ncbi:prolyl oligopeptidase family serine peptidase [Aquimarina sediminis]|uniref:prolyl oligopeptidase family serine peptidase n=1 Tax=Aquimarina sediminis TaxID=2070536 RepID=UPI000CA074F8|nr:prolyl oligopeptidase family serine peptidase [Aquimarina sediminis]